MSDKLYQPWEGALFVEEVKSWLIFSSIRQEEGNCYAKDADFVFLQASVRGYSVAFRGV